MKATDFRLKNLVHVYGIETEITPTHLQNIQNANEKGKVIVDMTPIPLTEEWLIKMGFEKHNSYYLSPNKSSVEGFVDILCFDLENLSFIVDMSEYSGWTVDCKFVHTLQNLYYALTNEELTINN